MSDETKKLIEDLKAIRLELFRSAANLDEAITQIEIGTHKETSAGLVRALARGICSDRNVMSNIRNWDQLNELEKETWTKLIDSLK